MVKSVVEPARAKRGGDFIAEYKPIEGTVVQLTRRVEELEAELEKQQKINGELFSWINALREFVGGP